MVHGSRRPSSEAVKSERTKRNGSGKHIPGTIPLSEKHLALSVPPLSNKRCTNRVDAGASGYYGRCGNTSCIAVHFSCIWREIRRHPRSP
jgi:hypothetical protein